MSRETYATFFKPRIRRIVEAAKEVNPDILIFMHSCGKIEGMIDDLIEAGVEILNPLHTRSRVVQRFGDDSGKICRETLFLGWHRCTVGYAAWNAAGGGNQNAGNDPGFGTGNRFLVAPAHILDPAIPWENIEAFIRTVKRL